MNYDAIDQKIQTIAGKIVDQYKPEKIILFGSYVWGKPTEDSDVDLLVVKETKKNRFEREHELRIMIFPAGLPVDVLVYTPSELERRRNLGDLFVEDIVSKGKVLYDRSN